MHDSVAPKVVVATMNVFFLDSFSCILKRIRRKNEISAVMLFFFFFASINICSKRAAGLRVTPLYKNMGNSKLIRVQKKTKNKKCDLFVALIRSQSFVWLPHFVHGLCVQGTAVDKTPQSMLYFSWWDVISLRFLVFSLRLVWRKYRIKSYMCLNMRTWLGRKPFPVLW